MKEVADILRQWKTEHSQKKSHRRTRPMTSPQTALTARKQTQTKHKGN